MSEVKGTNELRGLKGETKRGSTLARNIAFFYMGLAICNAMFFSALVFENQMDLLGRLILEEIEEEGESLLETLKGNPLDQDWLTRELAARGIREFVVTDSEGATRFLSDKASNSLKVDPLLAAFRRRAAPLGQSLDQSVDWDNRSLTATFHVGTEYLFIQRPLRGFSERMASLYKQAGLLIGWTLLANVLFGLYVYRKIFKRIKTLEENSALLAAGHLDSRVPALAETGDELDSLGHAFNSMAEAIESQIKSLNDRDRQMQAELGMGRLVQGQFLPDPDIIRELSPAVEYVPLREVSGDIYNFYKHSEDGPRVIMLADATGHGVSAALVTAIIHFHFQETINASLNPLRAIRFISKALMDTLDSSAFATGVIMVIDKDYRLYFVNAAHNPPVLMQRKSGKLVILEPTGLLLGVEEFEPFQVQTIQLRPGDRLFLYTDGITEAQNEAGEMFTEPRLHELLKENSHLTVQENVSRIVQAARDWAPEFHDDVTVIGLEMPESK